MSSALLIFNFSFLIQRVYAIVDIETTGGSASTSGITEVSIYVHDGKKIIDHFTTLINPGHRIPLYITSLTGINNAMVASAPMFDEVADRIYEILSENIFIAHNVNFDFSFLKHHLKECGYNLIVKKLCTVRLSRKTFIGLPSYSLGNLCRSLHIPLENRHRADGDAKATVLLFEKILTANGQNHIDEMLKKSSGEQWLPLQLDKKVIDGLPVKPGVYYFHDAKGKIIYVGKAVNIRKRVSSHFTHNDAALRRQHFLRLIANITFKECTNELHALVLESTEIKRLWPKYNYSQKEPLQKYALYSYEDNKGYIRLAIDKKKKNIPSLCNFNLLYDGITMLRKMAEQFELHEKLCYIDKNPFTADELLALDEPEIHNQKVKAALQELHLQLPTFAVIEKSTKQNELLCLLMEKGSFWGMGYIDHKLKNAAIDTLKEQLQPYADNNFIRNSIYSYVEANPTKKIIFQS